MTNRKTYTAAVLPLFLSVLFLFFTDSAMADARQKYLEADSCYKKIRSKSIRKQTESEWLECISRYETIYRSYPDSSWAPAGMYKAGELYIKLAGLSGKKIYYTQAADLLIRLKNRYPGSAYAGRSKNLFKSMDIDPEQYAAKQVRHIKSKKRLTKNDVLMKQFRQDENQEYAHAADDESQSQPPEEKLSGDATVSELRFWSNPEYTRIVVNADRERDYTHRLLKKDPEINQVFQRLYIDIDQAKLGSHVAEHTQINDNLLKAARAGQYMPHTVRVVVDIKSFENYKIFSLKDPFRIVIDVWGSGAGDGGSSPALAQTRNADSTAPDKQEQLERVTTDNLKSSDIARQLALGVNTIVIDPGHGGKDPGAPGYFKGVWEKDIVLRLAKKLAKTLRDQLQCNVYLTRSTDKKLTLEERTAIANTKKADLFISLHCNAAKNRNLRGLETYFLNLATDERAIAVAAKENATSEKNISDLEYILNDLMKHAKINESRRLASVVHGSFVKGMQNKYTGINDLGVKQAPFYVLLGARMPSILIETSFISNKAECKRLMSDEYHTAVSNTITQGIKKYIDATNPKLLSVNTAESAN